jgi:uncharacterized protein (DUF2132 family)
VPRLRHRVIGGAPEVRRAGAWPFNMERIVRGVAQRHHGRRSETVGTLVPIHTHDPSINSSLKFLRKTPWAREKVEGLYLFMLREEARSSISLTTDSALPAPLLLPAASEEETVQGR